MWKAATMLLFLHSEAKGAVFWGKSGKIHRLCPLSQPHANRSDPIRVWISLDTVASGQGLEHWHSAKALLRICWSIYILHHTTVFDLASLGCPVCVAQYLEACLSHFIFRKDQCLWVTKLRQSSLMLHHDSVFTHELKTMRRTWCT